MATRLLTRSKTLNRSLLNQPSQSVRPLHSLPSPLDLGSYQSSDSRFPSSRIVRRPDLAAGSASPVIFSILGSKKILGYEKTLPRWFSVNAQSGPVSQIFSAEKKEVGKVVSGIEGKVVVEPASHVDGNKVIPHYEPRRQDTEISRK